MESEKLRVGFLQFRPIFGRSRKNLETILRMLDGVSADLIVLPELPFTGYFFRDREECSALAEDPAGSPIVDTLARFCRDRDIHIVTGFAEKKKDRVFNSGLLIGPHGLEHTYRKLHLFNDEKTWFDPGDTPLSAQDVRGTRIGIMVCFDWIFPETCRILAIEGAEIICHPSNLVLDFCQSAMITRCLENRVFAVTANRFGEDRRPHGVLRFTGRSQIVAPGGRLIKRARRDRQALFVTDFDLSEARQKSVTERNDVLRDRRPGFYGSLVT